MYASTKGITFELSGPKGRSLFASGGGPQGRNVLERVVIQIHSNLQKYSKKFLTDSTASTFVFMQSPSKTYFV